MDTKKKEKAPKKCQCRCGNTTKGGRYLPGHRWRHKRELIDAAIGGSMRAANLLQALGWGKCLEAAWAKHAKNKTAGQTSAENTQPGEVAPCRRGGRRKHIEGVSAVQAENVNPETAPVDA